MKNYLLAIAMVGCAVPALAQNIITGTVVDEDSHRPLIGATVYIPDLKRGAVTDTAGQFRIERLPALSFLLEVRYIGYAAKTIRTGATPASPALVIHMSHAATEMDGVVVTGVSTAIERQRNPVPTIAVKHAALLETTSTNPVDAIAQLPGVDQLTTGTAISKPMIRGLGFNRVVVLRDGIRQEGQQWGDEHGVELDPYDVDRVEIVKGPGSIMYGSDALAGVINFQSAHAVQEKKVGGEALVEYQTNAGLFGASLMQTGNLNGIHWRGRASYRRAGNFQNAEDGFVLNSGFEERNGSASVGVSRKWGQSIVAFATFNQRLGLVEGERDSLGFFLKPVAQNDTTVGEISMTQNELKGYVNSIEVPFQRINHNRVAWSNTLFVGVSKLTADVGWQQNVRREMAEILEPDEAELHFILNTFNADVKYLLPEFHGIHISTGLAAQHQANQNHGHEYIIPDYTQRDGGVFAFAHRHFNKLYLGGGARYDARWLDAEGLYLDEDGEPVSQDMAAELKFASFSRTFENASATVGASYQLSRAAAVRINAARGFRAPNLAELASNGVHEGTFRFLIGDHALRSETSLQFDGGFSFAGKHVNIDLAAFHNRIANYIYLEKLSAVLGGDSLIGDDANPAFRFVQGNAALYGGELLVDIHPHRYDWLHWETTFSWVNGQRLGESTDSTRYLPFIPAPKLKTEIRLQQHQPRTRVANAFVAVSGMYFLEQTNVYSAYGTETETPSYFLLNAGVGADLVNAKKKSVLRLFVTASNLLDTVYQSHLSRLKYAPENPATGRSGVFNPGRNVSVKMIVPVGL